MKHEKNRYIIYNNNSVMFKAAPRCSDVDSSVRLVRSARGKRFPSLNEITIPLSFSVILYMVQRSTNTKYCI